MPRPIRSHGGEAVSASLSIKLDVIAGTHAKHAASALSRIAAQLWVIAEADFNGTRIRGLPDMRPGERFTSGYGDGVIVDAGSGANFVVIFDSGQWAGQRMMLHPSEFTRAAGNSHEGR